MTVGIERSFLSKTGFIIVSPILLAGIFIQGGCGTFSRTDAPGMNSEPEKPERNDTAQAPSAKAEPVKIELDEKQKVFSSIDMRLQVLEAKLTSLNDKLDSTKANLETLTANMKSKDTETLPHPVDSVGLSSGLKQVPAASNDPEAGFINDDSIAAFRKALILYQGQKYPEAVLSFSQFIETYPDYPLAGSAQYYIGESYFHQKEYKLARQEFQRVLNNYDQSPHVSDSILGLASSSELLRDVDNAAKYRQMLSSTFPQSPAAGVPRSALASLGGLESPHSKVDEAPLPSLNQKNDTPTASVSPPMRSSAPVTGTDTRTGTEETPRALADTHSTDPSVPPHPRSAPIAGHSTEHGYPATAPIGLVDHP
jgi:tol-pal system protein YbgF